MGPTALLDLEDSRLRLRAQALTQLCKSEREKALACYAFVKRLAYATPLRLRLRSARQVLDAGCGDATDKATLLVALLRASGIAARLHIVEVHADVARGLTLASATRPIVEAWLQGGWVPTDTYIYDACYTAGARQRLRELGWDSGFGIHRDGHALWNGVEGAWVAGLPAETDPMVLADLGHWHDPLAYARSTSLRERQRRLARALRSMLAMPWMARVIRKLREGDRPDMAAPHHKHS
jgi:hypothetical protein